MLSISAQHQVHELDVCWNNANRKIGGYGQWESVKMLIFYMQRLDFRKLYDFRRLMLFVFTGPKIPCFETQNV